MIWFLNAWQCMISPQKNVWHKFGSCYLSSNSTSCGIILLNNLMTQTFALFATIVCAFTVQHHYIMTSYKLILPIWLLHLVKSVLCSLKAFGLMLTFVFQTVSVLLFVLKKAICNMGFCVLGSCLMWTWKINKHTW